MFDTIESALEDLRNGHMIIVVDDENRENEGDLVAITEFMHENTINFMATHGRGLICSPVNETIAKRLNLNFMTQSEDHQQTAFTVSIDHISSTTGISALERDQTARALIDPNSRPQDFVRPGHLFPLIAKPGGLAERMGHTEACVELAKLVGAAPSGVICEIMNDDGTMARRDDLIKFKEKHNLKLITIESLKDFIMSNLTVEEKVFMPTKYGNFDMYGITCDNKEYIVLTKGELSGRVNVRMHSSCATGDIFHSMRCDCGEQLEAYMRYIHTHGGMIIYIPHEGRGIGLMNKLKAYKLIEKGYDTVTANESLGFKADLRDYNGAYKILKHFNINKVNLLSNNPKKIISLKRLGINVKRVPIVIEPNKNNLTYLQTKSNKMGHLDLKLRRV